MTREQIQKIFNSIINGDEQYISQYITDEELRERFLISQRSVEGMDANLEEEIWGNIINNIRTNNNWDLFAEIGLKEDRPIFIEIIRNTTISVEEARKCMSISEVKGHSAQIIISATEDVDFIKECINNTEFNFDNSEKRELIKSTKDASFIREYISNQEIYPTSGSKIDAIKSTGDIEFIKECINNEELELSINNKAVLVAETNDIEYIKEFFFSEEKNLLIQYKIQLIKAMQDKEYIKMFLQENNDNVKIFISDKIELVKATKDSQLIREFLEENGKEIDSSKKIELIEAIDDYELARELLEKDGDKLEVGEKSALIRKISKNSDSINKCLESKKIDETAKAIFELIASKEKFQEKRSTNVSDDFKAINLPPEMTIGVEIESEGIASGFISNIDYEKWKPTRDGSLVDGVEVVSPILKSTAKDSKDIYVICGMLSELGQASSERCGGHIHIGANYLTEKKSYTNLLTLWGNAEKVIYEISNPPGELVREGAVTQYAALFSGKVEKAMESGTINLDSEEDLTDFVSALKTVQGDRYSGINFMNLGKDGKNTIEFRLANGTLSPQTWIENINLFGGIVKTAEEITQIQNKPIELQTDEEKRKLEIFSKISSGELGEKETLDILLELAVEEGQRSIYEERYEENKRLYDSNNVIENAIKEGAAKKPIKAKDIGKGVFVGEDAITGSEMNAASERLQNDMVRLEENTIDEDIGEI